MATQQLPPSLSSVPSEFKKLCDEVGGPADIGITINKNYMEHCCRDYPASLLLPTLLRFQKDETIARRHWPWAAFAISHYVFQKSELAKYSDEPKPQEIIDLLGQITQAAHDLSSGLSRLQALSYRLSDPSTIHRRAHLAWLNEFISQAIAGQLTSDMNEDRDQLAVNHFKKLELIKQLSVIELAAKAATHRVDKSLLERERSQSDPALTDFVFRCGEIWKSLTGRIPSAEKIHPKIERDGPTEPDFVIFLQDLTQSAGIATRPSRHQVLTSLRKLRT